MHILRLIACYINPVITAITSILFVVFSGDGEGADIMNASDTVMFLYTLSSILFALLAVWVFSVGALMVLVQIIYGAVRYFTVKENKAFYLHYFYGFAISIVGYIVIFSTSPVF